jgi:hypothetical protein
MTSLPATLVEAEALIFAREWIARGQEGDFIGLGCGPLDPNAGHVFARRMIKLHALGHPLNMAEVIHCAHHGSDDADLALRELAAEMLDRGDPLPAALAAYTIEALHPAGLPRLRGQKKASNLMQDISIVALIMTLVERFGLSVRRNEATDHRASACSIVARALDEAGLTRGNKNPEEAVRKIWRRYSPSVVPGGEQSHNF